MSDYLPDEGRSNFSAWLTNSNLEESLPGILWAAVRLQVGALTTKYGQSVLQHLGLLVGMVSAADYSNMLARHRFPEGGFNFYQTYLLETHGTRPSILTMPKSHAGVCSEYNIITFTLAVSKTFFDKFIACLGLTLLGGSSA